MLQVVTSPDPLLREVCAPCEVGDESLKELADEMAETMYKNNGCGLAAPQVGVLKRIIVVDCSDTTVPDLMVLVNPELIETWGDDETTTEGCLSCPGISVPVTRKPWAKVRFYDLDGERWELESDGLLGRCLQHEIDHLNGVTLFESCDSIARMQAIIDYQKAIEAGAKPGDVSIEE